MGSVQFLNIHNVDRHRLRLGIKVTQLFPVQPTQSLFSILVYHFNLNGLQKAHINRKRGFQFWCSYYRLAMFESLILSRSKPTIEGKRKTAQDGCGPELRL